MFSKLLIANRGEIAIRIIQACRELSIRTVAVYSEADANARHVREADETVLIGPPAPRDSYLRVEKLIEAARQTGAQAIHPGYGFLSENADFADAVRAAGLIFVGPTGDSIRAMGSKTGARALMEQASVPVVPGFQLPSPSGRGAGGEGELAAFQQAAARIGYPVLVKAAGGGGGRGMRVVRAPEELAEALTSAQVEAQSAFGDGAVFLEKYLEYAKHIEFQVFGDAHGNVLHLFERECSVQRRHQKLIEEAPSPLLNQHPHLRAQMAQAAVAAARAVNYQNAGTIEFIVDPASLNFYFLEMNTRLQVEHPVTEALTGLDLVHLQLRVAAGEPLPFTQEYLTARGHAIECRVIAEDPAQNFLPSVGKVLLAHEPLGPGLRVDSGYGTGDEISPYYDSLIAKIITQAPTRVEAVARMQTALAGYALLGITTNIEFLQGVLAGEDFATGTMTTRLIQEKFTDWKPASVDSASALAAVALAESLSATQTRPASVNVTPAATSPWARTDSFRIGGS